MSVIVKGMRLPETCDDCEFHVYHSNREYVCVATPLFYPMNLANSKGIRKDWCPLVELPEKHGRLKDADVLIEELKGCHLPGAPYVDAGISIAIGKVCDVSTIIEAEGDEE